MLLDVVNFKGFYAGTAEQNDFFFSGHVLLDVFFLFSLRRQTNNNDP